MDSTKSKKDASRKEAAAPAAEPAKRKPLATFHKGDAIASVWSRDHMVRGVMTRFYSVTFERSYKDATGKYCYTRSFNSDDLGAVIALCHEVAEYVNGLNGLVQAPAQD